MPFIVSFNKGQLFLFHNFFLLVTIKVSLRQGDRGLARHLRCVKSCMGRNGQVNER